MAYVYNLFNVYTYVHVGITLILYTSNHRIGFVLYRIQGMESSAIEMKMRNNVLGANLKPIVFFTIGCV